MNLLTEEHAQSLLAHEWLVKPDAPGGSRLYFFKALVDDMCTIILVTDLERVWAEVLSRPQAEHRWLAYNPKSSTFDLWRIKLAAAHTTAGIDEVSFEQVESSNADLAIRLEYEGDGGWQWRWEAIDCGPRLSARLLASQLIKPLLSISYLALSSTSPPSELTDTELVNMIDKTARAARRMPETHARHAVGRGRPSSAFARMASLLGGLASPPSVVSEPEPPNLSLKQFVPPTLQRAGSPMTVSPPPVARSPVPLRAEQAREPSPPRGSPAFAVTSALVSEQEPQPQLLARPRNRLVRRARPSSPAPSPAADKDAIATDSHSGAPQTLPAAQPAAAFAPPANNSARPEGSAGARASSGTGSDSSRPPVPAVSASPPRKKPRESAGGNDSSDDDSEAERRRYVAGMRAGTTNRAGGARQPIKRGAKRF